MAAAAASEFWRVCSIHLIVAQRAEQNEAMLAATATIATVAIKKGSECETSFKKSQQRANKKRRKVRRQKRVFLQQPNEASAANFAFLVAPRILVCQCRQHRRRCRPNDGDDDDESASGRFEAKRRARAALVFRRNDGGDGGQLVATSRRAK